MSAEGTVCTYLATKHHGTQATTQEPSSGFPGDGTCMMYNIVLVARKGGTCMQQCSHDLGYLRR